MLYYEKYGKGRPVIILHGAFYDSRLYKHFAKHLAKKNKAFVVDAPYHGKSKGGVETLKDTVELLKEVVDYEKIKNPIIVGHSAGAILAFHYAVKYPVRKLVLIAPAGLKYAKSKIKLLFRLMWAVMLDSWRPCIVSKLKTKYVSMSNILRNFLNPQFWRFTSKFNNEDYSKVMKKIKVPVKIVWAKRDVIFSSKRALEYKNNFPKSKLVFCNVNHDGIINDPKCWRGLVD